MYFAHMGITLMLGTAVFLPLLIIAIPRFRSVAVAFAVSGGFSTGAMLGAIARSRLRRASSDRSWERR